MSVSCTKAFIKRVSRAARAHKTSRSRLIRSFVEAGLRRKQRK